MKIASLGPNPYMDLVVSPALPIPNLSVQPAASPEQERPGRSNLQEKKKKKGGGEVCTPTSAL